MTTNEKRKRICNAVQENYIKRLAKEVKFHFFMERQCEIKQVSRKKAGAA